MVKDVSLNSLPSREFNEFNRGAFFKLFLNFKIIRVIPSSESKEVM